MSTERRKTTALVLVDPQRSFCEKIDAGIQQGLHTGELYVDGAEEDMQRLGSLLEDIAYLFDSVTITRDCHPVSHISHPCWFFNERGAYPAPFTQMEVRGDSTIVGVEVRGGVKTEIGEYYVTNPDQLHHTFMYIREMEKNGRGPHIIWPYHCLTGTPGNLVVNSVMEPLIKWEQVTRKNINWLDKGALPNVTQMSAVRPDVIIPGYADASRALVMLVAWADRIVFAGEALSHCLGSTIQDLHTQFGNAGDTFLSRSILLRDATSNVPGFKELGDAYLAEFSQRGMQLMTCEELACLLAEEAKT